MRPKSGKTLCLGLIVCIVAVLAIVLPLTLLLPVETSQDDKTTFTLADYLNGSYSPRSLSLTWISDSEYIFMNSSGDVYRRRLPELDEYLFIHNWTNASINFVSPSKDYILLETNKKKGWRHSYTADYHVIDIINRRTTDTFPLQTIQYIAWSSKDSLAYVFENDIHLMQTVNDTAVSITTSGQDNLIFNGIPDWLYEEEIFSSKVAMWWSPDGGHLAFAQFNETGVECIEYSFYGEGQYPETISIPYTKAGTNLPKVTLFVVNVSDPGVHQKIEPPDNLADKDHYLAAVTWVNETRLCVQWMPRHQNASYLAFCDLSNTIWRCPKDYQTIEMSKTGWIGLYGPSKPFFGQDKTEYYRVLPSKQGYNHVHRIKSPDVTQQLTNGSWEVMAIVFVSADYLYYVSNQNDTFPGTSHLYKISKYNTNNPYISCVTCNLNIERCQYYNAYFSLKGTFFKLMCSGPEVPMETLHDTHSELVILEDNKELENRLHGLDRPKVEYGSLHMHGFDLWYQLILPPNLNKNHKHPLLIDVYGGPGSRKVAYKFKMDWAAYLASTERVIVARFDGRGTAYRGNKLLHAIYRRLGTFEVEDQISAARAFSEWAYVDEDRIAIWGWSYGGYVTSMVLGAGSGVFKCGIAVAPVSSWMYYDAAYTERYMGLPTPDDNKAAYESSTVMARAANFSTVKYLLVHGTADDNVHFQQSAHISKSLVENGIEFSAMWYTDKDHGLSDKAQKHLYIHLSNFLKQCFDLHPDP
uniref:dipeptidyl peptidase 4-like isoform X2 n=1 Tax=Myxine glutinosa TaxID=7769 RepID=UPI00358F8F79